MRRFQAIPNDSQETVDPVIAGSSPVLLLNSIEEMRLAMLVTSPGFGWAIMFIGSMALVIGGLIRPRAQTA